MHRLGHNAVLLIVGVLDGAAALRLGNGPGHGGGHCVGVHDHLALGISGGTANGLDEGGLGAQEALLVRIQNGHQGHLGQVQALSQQVDAHQHVELAQAQVPDDLGALQGVDVVVHIPHPDARPFQVVGEGLRHFLGQSGHQHPLALLSALVDLPDEIVHLSLDGPHLHQGVQQPRGPDDLLHHLPGPGALVLAGGGGNVHHLVEPCFKLVKLQGSVVVGTGQPEAVVHQGGLSGPVAVVHGPHLG